MITVFYT